MRLGSASETSTLLMLSRPLRSLAHHFVILHSLTFFFLLFFLCSLFFSLCVHCSSPLWFIVLYLNVFIVQALRRIPFISVYHSLRVYVQRYSFRWAWYLRWVWSLIKCIPFMRCLLFIELYRDKPAWPDWYMRNLCHYWNYSSMLPVGWESVTTDSLQHVSDELDDQDSMVRSQSAAVHSTRTSGWISRHFVLYNFQI